MINKIDEDREFEELVKSVLKKGDEACDKFEKEIDWEQENKAAIESSRKNYETVSMYDWATKQNSNMQDMMDKYGSKIVNEIRDYERNCQRVPSKTISDMHRINEGKTPYKSKNKHRKSKPYIPPKPKVINYPSKDDKKESVPKKYDNERYANIKAGIFNAARDKGSLKNPSTLLIYLIQEKPWDGKKDKHKTWDHWYNEKKLIVATRSVDQMAADLGVHRGTITRWSAALEKDGLIIKRKEGLETIYILGEVINGKERYFYCGDIEPGKSASNYVADVHPNR